MDEFELAAARESKLIDLLAPYDITVTYNPSKDAIRYRFKNGLIKPDFLCMDERTGKLAYCDLKTKTIPVYFAKADSYRHGFDVPTYDKYKKLSDISCTPFYIIFEEKDYINGWVGEHHGEKGSPINLGGHFVVSLSDDVIREEITARNPKPKVYWRREDLNPIHKIREVFGWT